MSGPPMEYDPRRLFPFGLSPIPEVPSELASEVSSCYSYDGYDDEESEADTEVEGAKTPGSIMYSGSCSSVKSNATLEDRAAASGASSATSEEEEEEESSEEETDTSDDEADDEDKGIDVQDNEVVTTGAVITSETNILQSSHLTTQDSIQQVVYSNSSAVKETTMTEEDPGDGDDEEEEDKVDEEEEELEEKEEEEEEETDESEEEEEEEEEEDEAENHYSSQVTAVTHQRAFKAVEENGTKPSAVKSEIEKSDSTVSLAIVPSASSSNLDPTPGAIAATEIFHHLQATTEKGDMTTELAKILSVLQTTLKEDSTSSSESDETSSEDGNNARPQHATKPEKDPPKPSQQALPLGKPPKCPTSMRSSSMSKIFGGKDQTFNKVGPEIQQRIRELATIRPEKGKKGKEEMSILSKILVTLLCSCKSAEATAELKKIIRHFRDAATEATDEVGDEIKPMVTGRTSSRAARKRRKSRSRRSSANSNGSNTSQSEAESLTNTLTPCNTDSKSSGTEDEGIGVPKRSVVCCTPTNDTPQKPVKFGLQLATEEIKEDANVTFTVSLPRRPSIEVAEISASISPTKMMAAMIKNEATEHNGEDGADEDDEDEWEWEEDDDTGSTRSHHGGKRLDSTSSRELSSADGGKMEHSIADSTTRKLFTDMECGAYNSDSMYSPGHNSGQSDIGVSVSEQSHESPAALEADSDCNVEEVGNEEVEDDDDDDDESSEEEDESEEEESSSEEEEEENLYSHLEETYRVLNGAYQIITGSKTESAAPAAAAVAAEVSPLKDHLKERSSSRQGRGGHSRPTSKMSRPVSRQRIGENGEEEEWGNEEDGDWEWEYYYEGDDEDREDGDGDGEGKPEEQFETRVSKATTAEVKQEASVTTNNRPHER
jgi:hypothetical protein